MTGETLIVDETSLARLSEAGRSFASLLRDAPGDATWARKLKLEQRELQAAIAQAVQGPRDENSSALLDNMRLIRTAQRDIRDLSHSIRDQHFVADPQAGGPSPRASRIARDYLASVADRFSEETLSAYLDGFQQVTELDMAELWALKPFLRIAILARIAGGDRSRWPELVASLRAVSEASWKDLFESVSIVDRVLARDPAGAYIAMDYDSRDLYRKAITDLARHSGQSEHAIAELALRFASQSVQGRASHVGFYLIDKGMAHMRAAIGFKPSFGVRIRQFILDNPNGFYLLGVELLTFLIIVGLLSALSTFTPIVAAFLLLLLPATQAAVEFMNNLTTSILKPRALPKLDFSKSIPADCATIVAVPTLLLNEGQVRDLILDLEIRFLANRDPNLYFALVTDSPDSDRPVDQFDAQDGLVELCRGSIDNLNRRYASGGRTPFFMFHRHRVFNRSEGRWMGWERKRGKLLDLNQLLRGGFDSFPVKAGDLSVLPSLRYVITLDSDTQLPRGSAAALVGAIAHPLNRAVVDPNTRMVVDGYGILQPRIGVSIESAARSRLASLYSGQTGFDIYTRAISDVYQDLYGEGSFTGKGIYDVDALNAVLHHRFPENALLSHDLIEGAYARAGLVSDIELIDDYPSHFSAYSRRKHRWVRGDWQILPWLTGRVRDYRHNLVPNPISLISRWKIFDNLRRSLIEPNLLLLFVAGWLYLPGGALYWTVATLAMLFLPVYADVLFSLIRAPWKSGSLRPWARDTAVAFAKGNLLTLLIIVFLLHQALLSIDAVVRSVLRVFITRRKLLEWETAAEAEAAVRPKATVDVYLEWTPWIAAAIGLVVWFVHREAIAMAAPIAGCWFVSRAISDFLNRAPRSRNSRLDVKETALLRDSAERIWRFFHDWSGASTNWLIPDSVREDGAVAPRISPTNMGMLLNARVAAVQFGFLSPGDFVAQTRQTLERLIALPKYRGHMLNWYDTDTMAPLEPRFVSTVDSGNLVASLWTLKQAVLAYAAEPAWKFTAELHEIADICDRLVSEMEFSFLYQPRKKVLSVGYDVASNRLESSSYDLLASESRIACFIAIAKGDIPNEAWFHLGRTHTLYRGQRILVSWTGTMFEYLMPALWMRHYPGTILEESASAVVGAQRDFARRKGVPWGISEAACRGEQPSEYGYAAFGIPELAMKRTDANLLVVSPYSTFLALAADPNAAIENLRRMAEFGWSGRYGFYEAVDYTFAGGEVIRSWMAHHQGMSLLAVCNVLFNNPFQRYFHAEPQVMATELLLHERVPSSVVVDEGEGEIVAVPAPA